MEWACGHKLGYGLIRYRICAGGLRSGPKLAFLSDGEDSIRSLQWHLTPRAQHLLDWFHLAMRPQRLRRFLVGLTHLDPVVGRQMPTALAHEVEPLAWQAKASLRAVPRSGMADLAVRSRLSKVQCSRPCRQRVPALYPPKNAYIIPDCGARWRRGQVISTAFIESLVPGH
jgi:hypothetical protein